MWCVGVTFRPGFYVYSLDRDIAEDEPATHKLPEAPGGLRHRRGGGMEKGSEDAAAGCSVRGCEPSKFPQEEAPCLASGLARTATDAVSPQTAKPSPGSRQPTATKQSDDPLRWFGVLVPPSLKSCQRRFQTGAVLFVCFSFSLTGNFAAER